MADTFEEARSDLVDLQVHRYRSGTGITSDYHRSRGLLVIPVMGPAGIPPKVVRVHAPYGTREVHWAGVKEGSPPLMPAAADTNSGDTILSESHRFSAPVAGMSGELVFNASGVFSYVQPDGGRGPDDEFPIDAQPYPSAVDMLGEFALPNPSADYFSKVIDGRYNREVIDNRILSAYKMIG